MGAALGLDSNSTKKAAFKLTSTHNCIYENPLNQGHILPGAWKLYDQAQLLFKDFL